MALHRVRKLEPLQTRPTPRIPAKTANSHMAFGHLPPKHRTQHSKRSLCLSPRRKMGPETETHLRRQCTTLPPNRPEPAKRLRQSPSSESSRRLPHARIPENDQVQAQAGRTRGRGALQHSPCPPHIHTNPTWRRS